MHHVAMPQAAKLTRMNTTRAVTAMRGDRIAREMSSAVTGSPGFLQLALALVRVLFMSPVTCDTPSCFSTDFAVFFRSSRCVTYDRIGAYWMPP